MNFVAIFNNGKHYSDGRFKQTFRLCNSGSYSVVPVYLFTDSQIKAVQWNIHGLVLCYWMNLRFVFANLPFALCSTYFFFHHRFFLCLRQTSNYLLTVCNWGKRLTYRHRDGFFIFNQEQLSEWFTRVSFP